MFIKGLLSGGTPLGPNLEPPFMSGSCLLLALGGLPELQLALCGSSAVQNEAPRGAQIRKFIFAVCFVHWFCKRYHGFIIALWVPWSIRNTTQIHASRMWTDVILQNIEISNLQPLWSLRAAVVCSILLPVADHCLRHLFRQE